MNKELKRELLKESEGSVLAKIALIELFIEEVEGVKVKLSHDRINAKLFKQAYNSAKHHYMKELDCYTLWDKFGNFIKNIF